MKRVYTSATPMMAGFLKNVLENAGVQCILKNYFLSGGSGELPINETWPELWVRPQDETCALAIIRLTLEAQANARDWVCPTCQERIEGQFQSCWKCGHQPVAE